MYKLTSDATAKAVATKRLKPKLKSEAARKAVVTRKARAIVK
jgi:hypothetical protein